MEKRPKKLLDRVRDAIRRKHYSIRTEEAYVSWIKRYIFFHNKRHPKDMGAAEIEAFLTHLAVNQHVAASTQNQALSALLFLYREVLKQELDRPIDANSRQTAEAVTHRPDQRGDAQGHWLPVRNAPVDGQTAVRQRLEAHGMSAVAREGRGLRPTADLC